METNQVTWDRGDLVRRLCSALDIAKKVLTRLAPNGYTDCVEPSLSVRPEKVISETAVLLLAASGAADPDVAARTSALAQMLIPHARSERMKLGVCIEPSLSLDYAQAHACLSRLGYPDPAFDKLLEQCMQSQARAGRERPPHRMLEQRWIAGLLGISPPGLERLSRSAAANSVLGHPMDLLSGGREDIYALTHALMFVADFSSRAPGLPRHRSAILSEAEAVLASCLDESDYDLAGEVLLAWPLLGGDWTPGAAFGFRVLARVEDAAGFLPSPGTRIEHLNKLEGEERTNCLLATAYHTAYVMGLVCAASLRPGKAPPANIPTQKSRPGAAQSILPLLGAGNGTAHWLAELDQLTDGERDVLADFVLIAALRRRVRERDFDAVRELLRVGYALGLADSPASSQAAEMLERLAIFGEIVREEGM
jgi:hypothetical protein